MPSNTDLHAEAKLAIATLADDTSVPSTQIHADLLDLAEYIALCIESLPEEPT